MRRRVKPKVSAEALAKMRATDAEAAWSGRFRCCGKKVRGTPTHIAKTIVEHMENGCGPQGRPDTPASPTDR